MFLSPRTARFFNLLEKAHKLENNRVSNPFVSSEKLPEICRKRGKETL